MAKTVQNLLNQIKSQITEISAHDALKKIQDSSSKSVLIDVREDHEIQNGILPGALTIPRGFLELKIEEAVPDRKQDVIIYCAGGNRSAFAVESLKRLGYDHCQSLQGGFGNWKNQGFPIEEVHSLKADQKERYHRHILLPEVGEEGQKKLLQSKVALVGAGGLGCPAALYLAAAGVGTLGIIDHDLVDRSNLQRQILHGEKEVGNLKVESAERRLHDLNPDIRIQTHPVRLDRNNVNEIFNDYDVIVNGCDNFPTRYLINDACFFLNKPLVDGSIFRFEGQASVIIPHEGPCYRCLYPEPPPPEMAPSCQEAGVLGVLPGIIGSIQAIETIKLLLNLGQSLQGRLLMFDSKNLEFRELKLRRDPNCILCGSKPEITELVDYEWFCSTGQSKT